MPRPCLFLNLFPQPIHVCSSSYTLLLPFTALLPFVAAAAAGEDFDGRPRFLLISCCDGGGGGDDKRHDFDDDFDGRPRFRFLTMILSM